MIIRFLQALLYELTFTYRPIPTNKFEKAPNPRYKSNDAYLARQVSLVDAPAKSALLVTEEPDGNGGGQEWSNALYLSKRPHAVDKLTAFDVEQLSNSGIDLQTDKRPELIKPLWAAGKSNKDIAEAFNGQSGYSLRTIEKYTAYFNKALRIEVSTKVNI